MHEHITRALYYLEVHLLYASLVWFAAWALTLNRHVSATAKYWIWVAASLNFIFPMGALFDKLWAAHLTWASPLGVIGALGADTTDNGPLSLFLSVAWLLGAILMFARLFSRIRLERRDAKNVVGQCAEGLRPSFLAQGVQVSFAGSGQVPAVSGMLRSHILLPDGIDRLLSRNELDAVLIHELTHAKRRDNLIRLVLEVGLCVLWFHPLLWIARSRLCLYRELSCDESVIQNGRGEDLVSALAKLVNPAPASLLQASAASHLSQRLGLLIASQPQQSWRAASAVLSVLFCTVLLGGIFETVAHTACCFLAKPSAAAGAASAPRIADSSPQ